MATSSANAKIKWAATPQLGLDEFELAVPAEVVGRVDIWKVPACSAYPQGIFVGVTSGQYFDGIEPGCCDWEKTLLAKVRFTGIPSSEEDMGQNVVEYVAPGLEVLTDELNPNDFSVLFPKQEGGE